MTKKIVFTCSFVFLVSAVSFSQKFMHATGATISLMTSRLTQGGTTATFSVQQTNLTYYPRINFIETNNSSLSFGTPISVGIGLFTTLNKNDAGIAFAYDLPAVIDYNIGFKSTKSNNKKFGYFIGSGFGYYRVNLSKSQYSNITGETYGILYRAGVRFGSKRADWKKMGIMLGFFYKKGMEAEHFSTYGSHILVDF